MGFSDTVGIVFSLMNKLINQPQLTEFWQHKSEVFILPLILAIELDTVIHLIEDRSRLPDLLCDILYKEMDIHGTVRINVAKQSYRTKQPFWNNELNELGLNLCLAEKRFLKCNDQNKRKELKNKFRYCRDTFISSLQDEMKDMILFISLYIVSSRWKTIVQMWWRKNPVGQTCPQEVQVVK